MNSSLQRNDKTDRDPHRKFCDMGDPDKVLLQKMTLICRKYRNSKLVDQLYDSCAQFCWQVAKERGTTVQNRAMP